MVKLPGGFSPWQAVQQIADDINPFDGGSRDRDIFSDKYNQRNGQPYAQPVKRNVIDVTVPKKRQQNGVVSDNNNTWNNGATTSVNQDDLRYLDDQQATLQRQLGRTGTALSQGLKELMAGYNREVSNANDDRSKILRNYGIQREDSERGKDRALDKVNTNARVLADSLRRRLGLAGAAGGSAYNIAAPNAVAREASGERTGVLEDYGMNFRNLDIAEQDAKSEYEKLLDELAGQRNARERSLRQGINEQRIDINEALGRIAKERALAQGGGYDQVKAAMSPYEQAIRGRESAIDNLFNKYGQKSYDVRKVNPQEVSLRDYMVDRAAIQANEQTGEQNPYAPYGNQLRGDDEEYLGL